MLKTLLYLILREPRIQGNLAEHLESRTSLTEAKWQYDTKYLRNKNMFHTFVFIGMIARIYSSQ